MFKTAIIVSQNSKCCSQEQGIDRLFPLVNAMKESDYMKNQFVKQDSLRRDFPHNIFRISHDSK